MNSYYIVFGNLDLYKRSEWMYFSKWNTLSKVGQRYQLRETAGDSELIRELVEELVT